MRTSQLEKHGLKHHLKRSLLPAGIAPRVIHFGLLAGLKMELDFAHNAQRWLGLQERELCTWFRRLSNGIRTAIDVGANEGMYTLYFLSKTSARKVFAFEPSEQSLERLKTNLTLNGLAENSRLEIVPKCVGASADGQMVTLDSFAERVQPPCLLKVDIDGGEVSLLEGTRVLLSSTTEMRCIIEVHSNALQEKCIDILQAANYHVVVVRNAWWRHILPELRPGELNQWIIALPRTTNLAKRG
jgi:hypothetical protein